MGRKSDRNQFDKLLVPFMEARTEEESQQALSKLIAEHAEPIIRKIIRSKLNQNVSGGRSTERDESEDVFSETVVRLLSRLTDLKKAPEQIAISSFDNYVAVVAYNSCFEYLRKKHPQRARLKSRLRYLLTHQQPLAMWSDDKDEWRCGYQSWRGSTDVAGPAQIDELMRDPLIDGFIGENLEELVSLALDRAGRPLKLDDLVKVVGAALRIGEDHREESVDTLSSPADPATAIEDRLFASRLWTEICRLPLQQKTALVLSARDSRGTDLVTLLHLARVATVAQVADALAVPALEFADISNRLPLDDDSIARRLNVSRRRVISLRQSARRRLLRRLEKDKR